MSGAEGAAGTYLPVLMEALNMTQGQTQGPGLGGGGAAPQPQPQSIGPIQPTPTSPQAIAAPQPSAPPAMSAPNTPASAPMAPMPLPSGGQGPLPAPVSAAAGGAAGEQGKSKLDQTLDDINRYGQLAQMFGGMATNMTSGPQLQGGAPPGPQPVGGLSPSAPPQSQGAGGAMDYQQLLALLAKLRR